MNAMELTSEQLNKVTARIGREIEEWLREHTVEPHYSAERTAELLEVTLRTVWNYVDLGDRTQGKEGIYPVVKLSHKVVRIPASSINRLLKSKTITIAPCELQEAGT